MNLDDSVTRAELLAIEQAAVRSWPALRTADIDGWLWRYSSGGSVRANTVAALAFSGRDIGAAVAEVERRYREARAPSRFTISEVSVPAALDEELARRGYARGDDHVTMAKRIAPGPGEPRGIEIGRDPHPEWTEVYLSGLTPDRRGVAERLLAGLPAQRMYFAARFGGRLMSSGLSVADGDVASVQCMATLPDAQRQGGASAVLEAIERWAARQGCRMLYLQTDAHNAGARALYAKCGFFLAGCYHTRVLED